MPFDFKKYDEKCAGLTAEQLQLEWNRYTRLITSASTSTAVSGAAVPATFGVSAVGIVLSAPALHNARKKRTIIERHLQTHNRTHETRARDVLPGVALSGASGAMGLQASHAAASAVLAHGAGAGAGIAVQGAVHAALEGANMAGEQLGEKRRMRKTAEEEDKKQIRDRRKELKAERKGEKKAQKTLKKEARREKRNGQEEDGSGSESEMQGRGGAVDAELPHGREPVEVQAPVWYHEADADAHAYGGARAHQMAAPTPAYVVSPLPPSGEDLKSMAAAVSAVEPGYYRGEPCRVGGGPSLGTTTYHELA